MNTTKGKDRFEFAWLSYNRKGVKKVAKAQWDRLTEEQEDMAIRHIPYYVSTRERVFCKDFERYLRDRVFENPVFDSKGQMVYDPEGIDTRRENVPVLEGFQG